MRGTTRLKRRLYTTKKRGVPIYKKARLMPVGYYANRNKRGNCFFVKTIEIVRLVRSPED